jgi:hypothetical protein
LSRDHLGFSPGLAAVVGDALDRILIEGTVFAAVVELEIAVLGEAEERFPEAPRWV